MALFKRNRSENTKPDSPMPTDNANGAEAENADTLAAEAEDKKLVALAEYVRLQTQGEHLVARKELTAASAEITDEELAELVEKLRQDEAYTDIVSIPGKETVYFYSSQFMSDSFARIQSRLHDKDLFALIAGSVREECQVYPRPALKSQFLEEPFFLGGEELDQVTREIDKDPEYGDIKVCVTSKGIPYLYSDRYLTERHALAIVDPQDLFDEH